MAQYHPKGTRIQTLIFDRDEFTESDALLWADDNDFTAYKLDTSGKYHRIRQIDPKKIKKGSFRTLELTDGVKAVIGQPIAAKKRATKKRPTKKRATKKRRNSTVRLESDLAMIAAEKGIESTDRSTRMKIFGNPIHIPKLPGRGRPSANPWWILDLYDSKKKKFKTIIGKGSKRTASTEAAGFIGHTQKPRTGNRRVVKTAMLSGPYKAKPTAKTARK